MQATKTLIKKVKIVVKKAPSTKIKNVVTIQDNAKRTLTKKRENTTRNKGEINEIPDINTATQEDGGHILPPN